MNCILGAAPRSVSPREDAQHFIAFLRDVQSEPANLTWRIGCDRAKPCGRINDYMILLAALSLKIFIDCNLIFILKRLRYSWPLNGIWVSFFRSIDQFPSVMQLTTFRCRAGAENAFSSRSESCGARSRPLVQTRLHSAGPNAVGIFSAYAIQKLGSARRRVPLAAGRERRLCCSVVENAGEELTYFLLVFGLNRGVIQFRG